MDLEIAREHLYTLIIQLQHGLILQLQEAQGGAKINNLSRVVTVTINTRVGALFALSELAQRLVAARPTERILSVRPRQPGSFRLQTLPISEEIPNEVSGSRVPAQRPRRETTIPLRSGVVHRGNCKRVTKNEYKSCTGERLRIPSSTWTEPGRCSRCNTRLTVEALTGSARYQQGLS